MNGNTLRRRAQRAIPIFEDDTCDHCGGSEIRLCRHHKNGNLEDNSTENIEILCLACHNKEHARMGTHRRLKPKTCPVCSEIFRPRKARSVLCGKRRCLSEYGRRAAERRWESSIA